MIPARLINPVEGVIVYKCTSLGSFSVVGSAELAAMNRVIADLPDNPQGQVPDKYDVKEVMKQTQSSMDPQIRAQFAQLLRTFSDVFSKSEWNIGECDLVQHKIDLYPGPKPVKLFTRRMPMHFKKDLRQNIDKILEHKLITPCHIPYSSPAMLVPKKNGKPRLVIDYRQLNKQTVKSCWPMPSVENNFDTLEGSCYFSTIDMSWGFYQLPFETDSQDYTAFSTPFGSFKWLVMPMGLTGSPPVFQSLMEKVLVGLTWKSTIPYLDDCIIFSRTAEEHLERLREVFQRFKDENLKMNPLKCEFFRQRVPFLGHIVSRDGIQADPAKTSAVRQYPVPKSVTEVKSFLGLCSYYRRYVRDFAAIARPLHQLTEKNERIPLEPRSPQGLWKTKRLPHVNAHFSLPLDERAFHPIYWCKSICRRRHPCPSTEWPQASHMLRLQISQQSSELLLDIKRELLTIVNYTRHFQHYLLGRQFKIITDHWGLRWLHNFKDPGALTARWLEKLAAFDYEIENQSGKSIGHADCMSLLPATTAALNMTATMDVDASVVGQPNHSSQSFPSFNSHTPPAQPSHSTTIARDTVQRNQTDDDQSGVKYGHEAGTNRNSQTDDEQSGVNYGHEAGTNRNSQTDDEQSGVKHGHEAGTNRNSQTDDEQSGVNYGHEAGTNRNSQTDDEQSGVKHGHEAGTNRNSQTDDEQSEVKNGNETVENKNGQTDDEQSGITHGHEAGTNKPVLNITVIEQQGDLLEFPHSIAYCFLADFKLGAGLAKQIKEKFPSYFSTKKEYKQQVLQAQYLGHDKFVFNLKTALFSRTNLPLPEKNLIGFAWSNEYLQNRQIGYSTSIMWFR